MSTNYLASVPKLKGRENYDVWTFAVENVLVLEGMLHCVKPVVGTEIKPEDDAKARAKLCLTIDPALYVHIKMTTTSKELWDKLKSLFDDSGFSRKISLLRHLISIRRENCEDMTTYVTQIVETSQRLSGTGFEITDQWIGSLMLAGLPERFSPMIMAIEHSGIAITADVIKTKLLDSEPLESMGKGMTSNETQNTESAFASKWVKPKPRHDKPIQSGNGGKSMSNVTVTGGNKNITCYKCKSPGHYRNQCPLLEKSNKNKTSNAFSAVFLSAKYSKDEWYVDSGASAHMTAIADWLEDVSSPQTCPEIMIANNDKLQVSCKGNVKISTRQGYDIIVKDVLCIPNLTTNLLSVSQLIKNNNSVSFSDNQCMIYNSKKELVAVAHLVEGVYKLDLCYTPLKTKCLLARDSASLWHRRLGHINTNDLNKMKNGAVEGVSYADSHEVTKSNCVVCCEGKQSRLPFPTGTRATKVLEIVHSDVCGPMETKSIGLSRYFLLFVDDYTRMSFVYFMKEKNEVFKYFREFKAMVEKQKNANIKILRTDNGGEYCSKEMEDFLKSCGIVHQKTNSYTPEQNGMSERNNRTIVERARCLIFDAKLDKKFWAEAVSTAVYLKNRSIASGLNDKTPYEMWHGKKPILSHLRIFGSPVMVHVPKERRTKWDKKSQQHILVGYSEHVKGYRVYDPVKNQVTTSRDVVVMETTASGGISAATEATWCVEETLPVPVGNDRSVGECSHQERSESDIQDSSDSESSQITFHEADADETYVPEFSSTCSSPIVSPEPEYRVLDRPKREIRKPARYNQMSLLATTDPELTVAAALSGPEGIQWRQAMDEELESFRKNEVFELVDAPKGATIVKCRWVLKKKSKSDGEVQYRARLVAKGFTQRQGLDYDETFSPVVRHSTLRLLFALSVKLGLDITHLDVKTAYLNGHLKEDIYMCAPEGYVSEMAGKVLKLHKAVYGLKQSAFVWYERVKDVLCKNNFKNCIQEPCIFTKLCNDVKIIIALYVDDFLIFSNSKNETDKLKCILNSEFEIKDLGEVKHYLGMNVNVYKDCNKHEIVVDQQQYIEELLLKFDMTDCRTADTPIESKLNVTKAEKCTPGINYQKLLGCLMYLAVMTRPDIAYSVSYLSQFNTCYSVEHFNYAKRILKYLKKTKMYCLKFSNEGESLQGFVDADWASDSLDRKSYTGFCFVMSGTAVSWQSRKQRVTALSSTEAEYVALSEACREAIYLRQLLYELTGSLITIRLNCDNQSALKMVTNHQCHNRSKHIDVKHHFVREVVNSGKLSVNYLSTNEMPADLLTKGLGTVKHYKFMEALGILKL